MTDSTDNLRYCLGYLHEVFMLITIVTNDQRCNGSGCDKWHHGK